MWKKTGLLIIIVLAFYGSLLVNNPSEGIKRAGYDSLLNLYADYRLHENDIKILYNPGLRKLDIDLQQVKVYAHLPQQKKNYHQVMADFLQSNRQVMVECSALDYWHSSDEGSAYLPQLRAKAYRVVIFDGGHHLPTLGLAPDILIVPVYKGYAVHGYMRDGMKVTRLLELLQSSHSQTILVTVSRWRLVKSENSLTGITQQILGQLDFSQAKPEDLRINCQPRISKYHSHIFIYVTKDYAQNPDLVIKRCRQLGLKEVKKVLVAFHYGGFSEAQADLYVKTLQSKLGRPVERVNEPLKVLDLVLRKQ